MNFEAVLAGLPDAVIAVDTELRVVFWNAAAEVLTERSARRAEGRYVKEIFSPEASVVRRLGETLATGESRSEAESFVERGDGRRVPVSIVTAPLCGRDGQRSEEHTSELQSLAYLVCRLLLEKKKKEKRKVPSRHVGLRMSKGHF